MEKTALKVPKWVLKQASVTFYNVAAYFWEDEWQRLEGWQQELYTQVMKEIHGALLELGHKIASPDILFRIKQDDEPHFKRPLDSKDNGKTTSSIISHNLSKPDLFFRIKETEEPYLMKSMKHESSEIVMKPKTSCENENSDVLLRNKQEKVHFQDSGGSIDHLNSSYKAEKLDMLLSSTQEEKCYLRNSQDSRGSIDRSSSRSVGVGPESAQKMKQEVEPSSSNNPDSATKEKKNSSPSDELVYHPDMSLWIKQVDEPELKVFEDSENSESLCRFIGGAGILVNSYDSLQIKQEDDMISIPLHCARTRNGANNPTSSPCRPAQGLLPMSPLSPNREDSCLSWLSPGGGAVCVSAGTETGANVGNTTQSDPFQEQDNHALHTGTTTGTGKEGVCRKRRQSNRNTDNQPDLTPHELGFSKVDDVNPYQCNTCMKCFTHFSNFKDHHRTHTGEKPFKCTMCKKSFSHSSNLTQHTRTHTGERPYNCAECDKTFTMKSHLLTHQRLHTGERPHVCTECGKTFTMKSHLITHQRLHTGERPYKCNECIQSYRKASDLVRHKRIHTGEKPYHCSLCEKRFNNLQCLKIHQRSHTGEKPYQCTQCEKGFLQNSDLIRHQKTHTGERPFQCNQCEKNFPQKSDLVRHEKIHAAERAYKCPECDKGFNLKSGLTRHRKLHAGMIRLLSDNSRPSCVDNSFFVS